MLDREGFRPNVGIILLNRKNQVFWGKRIRTHSWQFPQGGIDRGESPEQAMFRELHEEIGLQPHHVRIVARTRDWLRYEVPDRYIRREARGHYKGQKQIWYLLQMLGQDWDLNLRATSHPEFDAWRWNEYWVPLDVVVEFKRGVYEMALTELARFLPRHDTRMSVEGLWLCLPIDLNGRLWPLLDPLKSRSGPSGFKHPSARRSLGRHRPRCLGNARCSLASYAQAIAGSP